MLSEPPPHVPPAELTAALLGERLRDGLLEREDWLGLGLGFGDEEDEAAAVAAVAPVQLAPMASFTGGVMMRSQSLRRDSQVGDGGGEEEEEEEEEKAAAEAALREAAAATATATATTAEVLALPPKSRTWDQFMDAAAGERCVRANLVWKRSGLLARRRQLVLTSRGRLLYIDPAALVVKGTIAAEGLRVEVRGEHAFDVVTPQRVHHFTDYEQKAAAWAAAIGAVAVARGGQEAEAEVETKAGAVAIVKGSGRSGGSSSGGNGSKAASPSSSPVRMLPAALSMLGIGTGAGGSPKSPHPDLI